MASAALWRGTRTVYAWRRAEMRSAWARPVQWPKRSSRCPSSVTPPRARGEEATSRCTTAWPPGGRTARTRIARGPALTSSRRRRRPARTVQAASPSAGPSLRPGRDKPGAVPQHAREQQHPVEQRPCRQAARPKGERSVDGVGANVKVHSVNAFAQQGEQSIGKPQRRGEAVADAGASPAGHRVELGQLQRQTGPPRRAAEPGRRSGRSR